MKSNMKSPDLSISNQILSPMIKGRSKSGVIAELQGDPNPILFKTFDEVRDWFETIRTNQINERLETWYSDEEFELFEAVREISRTGSIKLCEQYRFPSPQSRQFLAFKLLVYYDFTVMVEREVWDELNRIPKKYKPHRILPKLTDYYYSFGHWDRHNNLLIELEAKILDEGIKKRAVVQFFKKLLEHRDKFKRDLENSFNFKNTLIYKRAPLIYGIFFKNKYPDQYGTIKEEISDLIKAEAISTLKEKVNNDLSFAMVFVNYYYDLKIALSQERGKPGPKWVPPKEAIADYVLPIKFVFSQLRIKHPGYWTVRLLNSFANTDIYSEIRFDESPLQMPDEGLGQTYAARHGYVVHGEVQLNSDLKRARKKLSMA